MRGRLGWCVRGESVSRCDGDRNGVDVPARRILTSTPALRKSAILVKGTKYPMCAAGPMSAWKRFGRRTTYDARLEWFLR